MDFSLTEREGEEILRIKRELHMHPELSHREKRTSALIREIVSSLPGMEELALPRPLETGVLFRLRGGKWGGETGLRADIDALPIQEQYESPYKSLTDGIMHGCGHDFHTAALIGAAMILTRQRDLLPGTVDFLFQMGEESTDGMRDTLEAGLLQVIHPKRFFAIHNRPEVPAGKVVIQAGPLMSAKANFDLTVLGAGGHGAMPQLARDPISASALIISALQTVVSRNIAPGDNAILTIGAIHGGSTENLIPDRVQMKGSVRSLSQKTRDMEMERLEAISKHVAEACLCRAELSFREELPAVVNSPEMTEIARRAAGLSAGEENLVQAEPSLASEDFALLMEHVPSYLYWVGSGTEGEELSAWHNPGFHTNDAALPVAAGVYASSAVLSNERG